MTITYKNFEELAEEMCRGGSVMHAYNCAKNRYTDGDPCLLWQTGVLAFAEWLDHIGVKVEIADGAEDFYTFYAKMRKVNKEQIVKLTKAGDRIIALISQISDQATEEQVVEHTQMVKSFKQIWNEAKE